MGQGNISQTELEKFRIKLCEKVICVLGVYVGVDLRICNENNWDNKVTGIRNILRMWSQRQLTLQGRAIVINSLLMSRCWYCLTSHTIPLAVITDIKTLCIDFLWHKGAHLVAYDTIIGKRKDGGLNVPDIELKLKAFRLKFLLRW